MQSVSRSGCCSRMSFFGGNGLQEPLLTRYEYAGRDYTMPNNYENSTEGHFCTFIDRSVEEAMIGGWKIHIALTGGGEQVGEAWRDVIRPELLSCGIKQFKIAQPEHLHLTATGQVGQGKVVTIF